MTETLKRHFHLIKTLVDRGTQFFDYGNAFLRTVNSTGVNRIAEERQGHLAGFIFLSYVEDIKSYTGLRLRTLPLEKGSSRDPEDLRGIDRWAMDRIDPEPSADKDNWVWIRDAGEERSWWGSPMPHPVSGCGGARAHRAEVQRDGAQRRSGR